MSGKVENDKPNTSEPEESPGHEELMTGQSEVEPEEGRVEKDDNIAEGTSQPRKLKGLTGLYWTKRKWTLPATVVGLLLVVAAVPFTRYQVFGLFLKEQVSVMVFDSKTDTPVSAAEVTLAGRAFKTDASGKASGKVKLGRTTLRVAKQYYKAFEQGETVTFSKVHNAFKVKLIATGRQVPIRVINKVTGQGLQGAVIKVLDTEAKTDKNGQATVVLPVSAATQKASISLTGYNNVSTNVRVTGKVVSQNTFSLTPSGKFYFLSNLTGKINVVETDLDGSDRHMVLAGTGQEDPNNTRLFASNDWKYLALLSKRDGGNYAKLFLINTTNNKVTTMDEGPATFSPIGWSGHYFIYRVYRNDIKSWQSHQQALKSYDADQNSIATIDQSTAQGTQYAYTSNSIGSINIMGNHVIYSMDPYSSYSNNYVGMHEKIMSVDNDGSNKKVLKDIALPHYTDISYVNLYALEANPATLYFNYSVSYNFSQSPPNQYYVYSDTTNSIQSLNATTFAQAQQDRKTYIVSPDGNASFWSEQRDGKNALIVGNYEGGAGKVVASLNGYMPYGWFTNKYLLVEKSSSVYIMSVDGGKSPQKITDIYGGGYGGM